MSGLFKIIYPVFSLFRVVKARKSLHGEMFQNGLFTMQLLSWPAKATQILIVNL